MKKLLAISFISFFSSFAIAQNISNADTLILTIQPNSEEGIDAEIFSCSTFGYDTTNYGDIEDICATAWTRNGSPTVVRSLMRFDISQIPANAIISSATLSLYHNPVSPEGQHSCLSGSNTSVLQRITSPWAENSVTWNTRPQVTTLHQVYLPASISGTQNFLNIDVTQLVIDSKNNPASGYGFMLKLTNEQYYRKLVFASTDYPVDSLHPKLEIKYYFTASIRPLLSAAGIILSPNPAQNNITLTSDFPLGNVKADIYDITGKKLYQSEIHLAGKAQIDVSFLSSGLYILALTREEDLISRQKFIVRK